MTEIKLRQIGQDGALDGDVITWNDSVGEWEASSPGSGGINSLNGLTAASQTFATGTSGTDFNINSTTSTHTFNFPTSSATNRGLLSTADWSTFNGKQNAISWNNVTAASSKITLAGTPTGSVNAPFSIDVNEGNLTLNNIGGTLGTTKGGTGLTTYAQGDLIIASAANTLAVLPKSALATRYLSNTGASNAPAWAQIDLTNGVTGKLPFANIADITTARLLGRNTAGTGVVEQLTVTGGIEFSGTSVRTTAFTGDATKTAGGTVLTLATVNSNTGSFGSATQVGTFTVNAKGLITAASNTSIAIPSTAVTDFAEAVDDRVAVLIQNGTGITWTYNDASNTLTPTVTITQYTDELAQDAVGTILTDSDTIDFTYNDAGNTITAITKQQMSITSDASGLKLSGDATSPGNNKVYGTDGSGAKGWYNTSSGGSSSGIAGSVQFSDGSGGFSSDASNFFFDDTTNQLQLAGGTSYALSIFGDNGGIQIQPTSSPKSGALNAINITGNATGNMNVNIINTNTGSTASSRLLLNTASAGGDPFVAFSVGDTQYSMGIDNSDEDKFKLGLGSNPSSLTGNSFTVSGEQIGIGDITSPTATLHLPAHSATANTAPIKLTSGTAMTTPEDGAIEYHGSHLYFTIGSTRYQLDQQGGGGDISNGGNTFGGAITIGSNDNFALNFETNNTTRMSLDSTSINIGKALTNRVVLESSAGSTSGAIEVISTNTTANNIALKVTGPSINSSSAANDIVQITNSYTATSGFGFVSSLGIRPTINLSSSSAGSAIGIEIAPTITNLTGKFYGFYVNVNNANAYGMYQSGANTLNVLNGKLAIGSTTDPTEALTVTGNGLIDGNVKVTGQYHSERFGLTDGATIALDWDNSNVQSVTIQGNRTFTFANPEEGGRYIILVTQGTGGNKTLTWPTIKWRGGTAPTLSTAANKVDIITLVYANGSYYGDISKDY